jgi:MFS transporter, FHS family, L-fucose permease
LLARRLSLTLTKLPHHAQKNVASLRIQWLFHSICFKTLSTFLSFFASCQKNKFGEVVVSHHGSSAPAQSAAAFPVKDSMLPFTFLLFFIVGFTTVLVDPLVAKFKGAFDLSYTEALLTQSAYFMAYFLFSIPASTLLARLGYMRGTVLGLCTIGVGILLFIPAVEIARYWVFLLALFIIACGVTTVQVAMNPLASGLGKPESATTRLTLAQAFNSLATTVGPMAAAYTIFHGVTETTTSSGTEALRVLEGPCVVLAGFMFGAALIFWFLRRNETVVHKEEARWRMPSLSDNPRLAFGTLGIFAYVGAEVAIGSLIINFLKLNSTLSLPEATASEYLSYYWGGAMVGRFIGSVVMTKVAPWRVLCFCAVVTASLACFAAFSTGPLSAYALLSIGLFNSIMFPSIFSLAIKDMGDQTPAASGLLCLAIVGGAIVPLLTGQVADRFDLHIAFLTPAAFYLVIIAFAALCGKGRLENGLAARRAAGL